MNVWTISGNIGNDCRKGSAGGTAVVNFSVAVKSGYGDKAQTVWVDCSIWGRQAEGKLPDYLVKGQQVVVSGELGTREHESKTYITLRVNSIDLVGSKAEGGQQSAPRQQQTPPPDADDFDDDVPF